MKQFFVLSCMVFCALYADASHVGNRLLLSRIQLIDQNATELTIRLNALNMGSAMIRFGENPVLPDDFELVFEESFERNRLFPYREDITDALMQSDLELLPRKYVKGIELVLFKNKPLAEAYTGQTYNASIFGERKKKRKSKNKPQKTSPDTTTSLATTDTPSANPQLSKEPPDSTIVMSDVSAEKRKHRAEEQTKPKRKVQPVEQESADFATDTSEAEDAFYDKDGCSDIVIEKIQIIENKKDKWLTIEYTIRNTGNSPMDVFGKAGNDNDNLAIKAYLASTERLSRGSLPIGGAFIQNGLDEGLLLPNQTYTGRIKLDIRKKTRFNSFLILNADPFNTFRECDKTNNKSAVFIE